jgi:hypothetical protein
VRGRGDARPPSRAGSKALPGTAAAERTTGAWHLLESRHASRRSEIVIRDSRQCLAPQPGGHDIGRMRTHPGRAAFGVAVPGIASSAFQDPRDGGACARTRRCQAPSRVPARWPCRVPQSLNGRLGPGISSNRAMLHVAAKSSSAIRGNAWPRNPEAAMSAPRPRSLRGCGAGNFLREHRLGDVPVELRGRRDARHLRGRTPPVAGGRCHERYNFPMQFGAPQRQRSLPSWCVSP